MSLTVADGVAGVDGCRSGWVIATRRGVRVVEQLDLVVADADLSTIGIDIPMGLPQDWDREADRAARRYLGRRSSTIFPTPPRELLSLRTYPEANARSRERFGTGLTKQTFNLFPKIVEVDRLARVAPPDRLVEIHPECAFVAMCGAPLPPKRSVDGAVARLALLRPLYGDVVTARPSGARADDVLDAFAVLWSAERFARGAHFVHGPAERDGLGIPMRIVT
jgi:predicted RNase H-like nuclease